MRRREECANSPCRGGVETNRRNCGRALRLRCRQKSVRWNGSGFHQANPIFAVESYLKQLLPTRVPIPPRVARGGSLGRSRQVHSARESAACLGPVWSSRQSPLPGIRRLKFSKTYSWQTSHSAERRRVGGRSGQRTYCGGLQATVRDGPCGTQWLLTNNPKNVLTAPSRWRRFPSDSVARRRSIHSEWP